MMSTNRCLIYSDSQFFSQDPKVAECARLSCGLSLFELLVVLLLISLICAFGLPLSVQWIQNQQGWIMQKDIEQAVEYATQESVILGEPLRLLPYRKQDWSTGLRLVKECDVLHSKPKILHSWQWYHAGLTVKWQGFLSEFYLRFTPNLKQLALNGYFLIESDSQPPIKITLNKIGRARQH